MDAPTIRRIPDATPRPARGLWIRAVVALAAASIVVWWFEVESDDRRPALYVAVLLLVVALVQAARAVRAGLAARRFGTSVLDVEGGHVAPGGLLSGRVLTSRDLVPAAGFRVRLRCFETVRMASSAGSSQGRDEDRVAYEVENVVTDVTSSAREGVPVRFQLPDQAARTSTAGRGARWTLDITAEVEGGRYEAVFAVPVASRGA